MKIDDLKTVLSEKEQAKLTKFADDELMMNAVKKVLLFGMYYNGTLKEGQKPEPTKNFLLGLMSQVRSVPDEHLGQVLRGQMEGLTILENGYLDLNLFKSEPSKVEKQDINNPR